MEWFNELLKDLTEEQQTSITDAFKQEFPKHAIPKDQYAKKVAEISDLTEQLEKAQTDLTELSKSTGDVEALKQQIADKSAELETFKTETAARETKREKMSIFKRALEETGFIKSSVDLLANNADYDNMVLDSKNQIVDLDNYINPLKESYKDLMVVKKVVDDGTPPDSDKQDDLSGLSDQEYFNKKMKSD